MNRDQVAAQSREIHARIVTAVEELSAATQERAALLRRIVAGEVADFRSEIPEPPHGIRIFADPRSEEATWARAVRAAGGSNA